MKLLRSPALWAGIVLWVVLCVAGKVLLRNVPGSSALPVGASIEIIALLLIMGVVQWIARRRPWPDLAARAPQRAIAARETVLLWVYGAAVMAAGMMVGRHFFGQGIAMHLVGSLVGTTHTQSPTEVCVWAAWNGILLALIPYLFFRARGYSNFQLNLKSADWKNDARIIALVLVVMLVVDSRSPGNIFQLPHHQQLVGGSLSFVLNLFGTDLPILIFIYAILLPRYFRLFSPVTAYLLGALSYPLMHVCEAGTVYDTPMHAAASLAAVFLGFFPAGLMKSYLTSRTGNAWVHLWAFHAISPHVTVDTRLIVNDFKIAP